MTESISVPAPRSPGARSLRSVDTASGSSSPLELPAGTLALLGQFHAQRAEEEERFARLEKLAEERRRAALGEAGTLESDEEEEGEEEQEETSGGVDANEGGAQEEKALSDLEHILRLEDGDKGTAGGVRPPAKRKGAKAKAGVGAAQSAALRMTVDDFRRDFGESWQLSQFWYSAAFSERLAKALQPLIPNAEANVVFISCPTAYVGFQHLYDRPNTHLFEYDTRFALIGAEEFVRYDLDEPLVLPERLVGQVDLAIVDPPFLNEVTSRKVARSVKALLKPGGQMLLLTGQSIAETAKVCYKEEAGVELRDTAMHVEHAGGLANAFGAWASWEGAESFGKE